MWAKRAALRKLLNANPVPVNLKSFNLASYQFQNCSRNLHTIRSAVRPFKCAEHGGLLFTPKYNRVTAYLVISRHDSTSTNTIPPLTSEVFSKQVEQTTGVSPITSETLQTVTTDLSLASTTGEPLVNAVPLTGTESSLVWENIPEPPALPNPLEELSTLVLSSNGEPTFASIGLGGWSPSGIVQQCMECFHVDLGLPWWSAIVLGTVCVRLLVFPLVIKSQRNAAKMANNLPQMQAIQLKMTEARQTGNALMAAKYSQDLMLFMKEKDISPFKNVLVPLAMAPIFISFFFGLRKMANLPVESMRDGGLFWFADLTIADPFFILPLMTSVTMWITMEMGVDGVQLNSSNHGQVMRYAIRALPLIMFPMTMNFPAAILCYWVSTNAVSLVQVSLLKFPAIRSKLKIDPIKRFSSDQLPMKKKKFLESLKDSWTNVKISKEMEDRVRYDEMSFKRAGRGPIPKTYKYDPTKTHSSVPANAIQAKKQQN